jgi:pyruvate/2-oxoglutarate dehydrogenase complex dihydrolipoamide dehydrogenase (E3) component
MMTFEGEIEMNKYDLVVIGAGAGGLSAAYTAKGFGKKVLLIEKEKPGGECTWSGCVPSKGLINLAKEIHHVKKWLPNYEVDTAVILNKVRGVIQNVYSGETPEKLQADGIHYINGAAKIVSQHKVEVNGETIESNKIVISTGSSPFVPPIEGINDVDYLTNENLFAQEKLPKSMLILGGGAIGIEMAQSLNRLGVEVSLVEMMDSILFREEQELVAILREELEKEGVKFFEKHKAVKIETNSEGNIALTVENDGKKSQLNAEGILVAVGRKANIDNLGLEEVGIETTRRGIVVNEKMETSIKNIYAVGDVAGPYQFSHMANVQGIAAAKNAILPINSKVDYTHVAWCTFSDPELARAGMSEEEARKSHEGVRVYEHSYEHLDRAKTKPGSVGKVKLILDKKGKVLGASVLGDRAGEIISEIQVVKTLGLNFSKLTNVIHPYPTYSEILNKISKKVTVDNILENPVVKLVRK